MAANTNIVALRVSITLAAVAVFIFVQTVLHPGAKQAESGWGHSLEGALAAAKESGKPILIDFDATWCGPCQQYKDEVFNTSAFAKEAKNFELVEINIDEQSVLAQHFRVEGIPDLRVLSNTGKEVAKFVGFEGVDIIPDIHMAASKLGSS